MGAPLGAPILVLDCASFIPFNFRVLARRQTLLFRLFRPSVVTTSGLHEWTVVFVHANVCTHARKVLKSRTVLSDQARGPILKDLFFMRLIAHNLDEHECSVLVTKFTRTEVVDEEHLARHQGAQGFHSFDRQRFVAVQIDDN